MSWYVGICRTQSGDMSYNCKIFQTQHTKWKVFLYLEYIHKIYIIIHVQTLNIGTSTSYVESHIIDERLTIWDISNFVVTNYHAL